MRRMERVFGALAGICGLAALVVVLTQHAMITHMAPAVLYGPGINPNPDTTAIMLTTGFAVVAALLVSASALWDSRRESARGRWTALVVLGAALSVASVYALAANSVWVSIGGSAPAYLGSVLISAALVFAPATLMSAIAGALALLAALRPRGHAAALA